MKMHKYLIGILPALVLGLVSCNRLEQPYAGQDALSAGEGGRITVEAAFDIPAREVTGTKALGEDPSIRNIYIAVFGSNHYLNEFVQAIPLTGPSPSGDISLDTDGKTLKYVASSDGKYYVRFILTEKSSACYVHILANVPDGKIPPDFDYEDIVMGQTLYTSGAVDGYWQYLPLDGVDSRPTGISSSSVSSFDGLKLVRNFARVKLEALSGSGFTVLGYQLYNTPDRASFAPYLGEDYYFHDNWVNGSGAQDYATLKAAYPGYLVPGTTLQNEPSTYTDDTDPKYVYEHPVDEVNPTYIVAKLHKNSDSNPDSYKFFRLDILDNTGSKSPLLRNYQYDLKIQSITTDGYTSPEVAAQHPSDYNYTMDPETQEIPEIRNYNALMETSYVEKVFTAPQMGAKFEYRYCTDYSDPVHTALPGRISSVVGAGEVQEGWSDGASGTESKDGWYVVSFDVEDPAVSLGSATDVSSTFTVQAGTGVNLIERQIRIISMKKRDLTLTSNTYNTSSGVLTFTFEVPAGLYESMFPLVFKYWSPDNLSPQGGDILSSFEKDENGNSRIVFNSYLTYPEYQTSRQIGFSFKAPVNPGTATLFITDEGGYFNTLSIGVSTFTNVGYSTLNLGEGKSTTFHFDYGGATNQDVTMKLTNLTPDPSDTRFTLVSAGTYTFSPGNSEVTQSFTLFSTDKFADGRVEMSATGYADGIYDVSRPTNLRVPVGAITIRRADGQYAPLRFTAGSTLVYFNANTSSFANNGASSTFSKNYYLNESEVIISKDMFPEWSATTPVYLWYQYKLLLISHNYRAATTLGDLLDAQTDHVLKLSFVEP